MTIKPVRVLSVSSMANRLKLYVSILGLVAASISTPSARAQALSGMSGTVTDSTGAIISGAHVTVTNVQTQVSKEIVTSSSGTFRITDLVPGTYNVKFTDTGFTPVLLNGVHVDVATVATANASMALGSTETTVEVNAPAITLETTQPSLGTTIESKLVEELPIQIAGRDRQIDSFIFLAPGVSGSTFSHRIDGGVDMQNEVVFNGIPAVQAETQGYQTNINPPFELVDQFQVLQNVFPAQYGLAQGVAQYQFSSGTNTLHGDAFEIFRNNYFDAEGANPNRNAAGIPDNVDRENNWGFSVGGPVIIPKLYNGKDKTFFYVSSDWYRQNQSIAGNITVPTPAMLTGDFSAFPQPIYVPTSGLIAGCIPGAAPGQQFPGNIIPQSCLSSVSKTLLSLVPAPTAPGFTNNLGSQINSAPQTQTNWGFNIDEKLTPKQTVHFSFWRDRFQSEAFDHPGYFNNELSAEKIEPTIGTGIFVTYTNTLSDHLVVTGGVGWLGEINNEFNAHRGVSFAGVASGDILPTINFGGNYAPTTWGVNSGGETNSTNRKLGLAFTNNWLYSHGRHTMNFGFEVRRAYQDDDECQGCGGEFTFSGVTTSNGDINTGDTLNENNTGSGFASYLLGTADSANRNLASENKLRNLYVAPYIQDDIKLTPKLTVNVGLRWDIARPFTDATKNNIVFFNSGAANSAAISPATGNSLAGGASVLGTCSYCVGYDRAEIHWREFSPRIGFAYQVNNKTVVLGGFSMNHLDGGPFEFGTNKVAVNYGNHLSGVFNVNSSGTNDPAYGNWDTRTMPLPAPTAFTSGLLNGQGFNSFSHDPSGLPYVMNYNFGVQRELPGSLLLSVSYVGNRALHLPSTLNNPNQLSPATLNSLCPNNATNCVLGQSWTSTAGQAVLQQAGFGMSGGLYTPYANFINDYGSSTILAQALKPYSQYNGIVNDFENAGVAEYNALQVQAQKRFTSGLSYLVSYTLSRTMSNTDSGFGTFNSGALNTYNQKAEWAVADNDQEHLLNISGVYEIPIGPGKPFLNSKNAINRLLVGGLQLSGTFQYSSGTPFTIGANGCPLQGYYCNRANVVAGVSHKLNWNNYYKGTPIFDTAAFSDPGLWALGDAPRNLSSLRNIWNQNENISMAKHFNFTDRVNGELRMEYFNVLNRMQVCSSTQTNVSNSQFGIDSAGGACQANSPRQGQANFKLQF
jgi:hypothetical protein